MPHGCRLASLDENHHLNEMKIACISLIIWADFCWVRMSKYQLHDSHPWSHIIAKMFFPKTHVSTINPNLVNTKQSPSCMKMTDVIIK